MFFGLEVKSGPAQAKPINLNQTLKLSQAVLEPPKNGKKEPVSLVVEYEKKQLILCVLDPSLAWQTPLDLLFEAGSEVKFFVRGAGTVHLTGYQVEDDLDDMSVTMSSDEEPEIDDNDLGIKELAKNKAKAIKNSAVKAKTNGVKVPTKKKDGDEVDEDEDDESSDDEDFSVDNLDVDDDDDDDDEEEEDDDDDDDDEEMSDENLEDADSDDE